MPIYQDGYDIRCEWGENGVTEIAARAECCVIVDTLSFSSCVDIAAARNCRLYPWEPGDDPDAYAASLGAECAQKRGNGRYTLSPNTLAELPEGTKLVLPSPNGSTLTRKARAKRLFAGSLRNARAVARALDGPAVIVPAGERWPDGTLRPAIEDLIGAGAIIAHCKGTKSPEALFAEAAFRAIADRLETVLQECATGNELVSRGYAHDIPPCAALDASNCVPELIDGCYRNITA